MQRLRLYTIDASAVGGRFHRVADSSWSESTVTWNNSPAADSTPFATLGAVTVGSWYDISLASLLTGDGTVSIRVTSTSTDGADYTSKEGTAGFRPELVVTTGEPAPPDTFVIAGAGDIADSATNSQKTASLLDAINPAVVFTTGDNAYPDGTLAEYQTYYHPTWGRYKAKTRPSPGNHEYNTAGASGYYDYFGSAAGTRGQGYYSYDLGAWHLIALNSNCSAVGGCGPGSAQYNWLASDLTATSATCIGAYWHHPRFASGHYGNDASTQPFWQLLYDAGAEFVLNGHDHNYQRYAPLTPTGLVDNVGGVREFVVGMGGRAQYPLVQPAPSTREAGNDNAFGILKLTLRPGSYDWAFVPEAGKTYADSGNDSC